MELENTYLPMVLKGHLSCVVPCPLSSIRTFSDFEAGSDESNAVELYLGR